MGSIPCFFLERTNRARMSLRRYQTGSHGKCPGEMGYHNAHADFGEGDVVFDDDGCYSPGQFAEPPHDEPRWPKTCACGYEFNDSDVWQLFTDLLYRRSDTGEPETLRDAPAGALWYADWLLGNGRWTGPDGRVLMCKTPGGDWNIDSRASNCTLPGDNEHRCWVRHGDPRDPIGSQLTVDKNGRTCQAGAGSILCGKYHGFLRGGHLVS